MPISLALPIFLRLAAALVFVVAVIVAGVMNRSIMMVPLLAGAATLTQWLLARIAPGPMASLQSSLGGAPQGPVPLNRLGGRFIAGVFGYGLLFILTVFISALFKETELERILTRTDLSILAIATGLAILLSLLNAHFGSKQVAGMMGDLEATFADMQRQQEREEAFTVEGEMIDPEDQRS